MPVMFKSYLESCWGCKFHIVQHLFCFFLILFSVAPLKSVCACTQVERDSLDSVRLQVTSSTALNWPTMKEDPNSNCCLWEGISCNKEGQVTQLWLPQRGLIGPFPLAIGNLSHLSQLNLSHNSLFGNLPLNLFLRLDRLEVLDLSYNNLSGEFVPTPPSLLTLDISTNVFTGEFPPLGPSFNLSLVNASDNSFSGPIPSSICANSSLRVLDFSWNKFSGVIPQGLGRCSKLAAFRAGFNYLSGSLPDDLYEIRSLQQLSLPFSGISGTLSNELIGNLSNLTILELNDNELRHEIPPSIGRLPRLEQLLIHNNKLNGHLPSALANCSKLKLLNLRNNSFTGEISPVNFSNLFQLRTLDLGDNNFTGSIPVSLYSCKSLTAVRLAMNKFQGEIQPQIRSLQGISFISLSNNNFTNIEGTFKILKNSMSLTALVLSRNFKGESIPENVDGFQSLRLLSLSGCRLKGQIPQWITKLAGLQVLDLSLNQLTGSIPSSLGALPNLFYLDLSNNHLVGELPLEITELPTLASIQVMSKVNQSYLELPVFVKKQNRTSYLLYNQLSNLPPAIFLKNNSLGGVIPPEFGYLQALRALDLSDNTFSGEIPDQLSNLTNLQSLDLSGNHLSGSIPQSFKQLNFLAVFSVADNSLQGPIPQGGQFDTFSSSSFEGNPGLCGFVLLRPCNGGQQVPPRALHNNTKKKLITGIILSVCLAGVFVLILLFLWLLYNRRMGLNAGVDNQKMGLDVLSCTDSSMDFENSSSLVLLSSSSDHDLTIDDILKSTGNFDQANIIGCGGFGLVYKATLPDGAQLAIKRLSGDLGLMVREFKAEVEALSNAQHRNLVSLQGYCVHDGARMLIYSYMENGSLDYWLHEKDDGRSRLDWPTRLRIAKGASKGLFYLHHICEPHIVHRDIKSSNILLDEEFEAHVADFGLSRLIHPYRTHVTTELVGTLGYIPPEYGQAWVATLRGDIYSFGVLLLELLTGRRPIEVFEPKISSELIGWVHQMRLEGKQDQVLDPLLSKKEFEQEMFQVLDVACMCVRQNPLMRPSITQVVSWLENVGPDLSRRSGLSVFLECRINREVVGR